MKSMLCKIILVSLIFSVNLCAADDNVSTAGRIVRSGLQSVMPSWLFNPQAQGKTLEQRVAEADQKAEKAKAELEIFEKLSAQYPLSASNDVVEQNKIAEKRIEKMDKYRCALEAASQVRRELQELEKIAALVEDESAEFDKLTKE